MARVQLARRAKIFCLSSSPDCVLTSGGLRVRDPLAAPTSLLSALLMIVLRLFQLFIYECGAAAGEELNVAEGYILCTLACYFCSARFPMAAQRSPVTKPYQLRAGFQAARITQRRQNIGLWRRCDHDFIGTISWPSVPLPPPQTKQSSRVRAHISGLVLCFYYVFRPQLRRGPGCRNPSSLTSPLLRFWLAIVFFCRDVANRGTYWVSSNGIVILAPLFRPPAVVFGGETRPIDSPFLRSGVSLLHSFAILVCCVMARCCANSQRSGTQSVGTADLLPQSVVSSPK